MDKATARRLELAFPVRFNDGTECSGMTLRDWFAGQALIGMGNWTDGHSMGLASAAENKARWAYHVADAMMKEREK